MDDLTVAEHEDLDPLAPVLYGTDEPAAPVVTDSVSAFGVADEVGADEPEAPADGGFSDGENIVRIWLEAGRLTKVRVSTNWHNRLAKGSLADAFGQAFWFANLQLAPEPTVVIDDFSDIDFSGMPRISTQSLGAMQTLFDDLTQRWDEAIQRFEGQPVPVYVPVVGKSKGVTVSLNQAGQAERVDFDPPWLDQAQAGNISIHVLRAANLAYERFTPYQVDRSELIAIEKEHAFLIAAFKAMLDPKEKR